MDCEVATLSGGNICKNIIISIYDWFIKNTIEVQSYNSFFDKWFLSFGKMQITTLKHFTLLLLFVDEFHFQNYL